MQINLYEHQGVFYDKIKHKLYNENVKKLCCVLPTGGGKSVVIGKLANDLEGRTLILTHRLEILQQNSNWVKNVGLLGGGINTLRYDNDIVICMVQTLHARIENYGVDYLGRFDNIILDECHILIFEKVFEQYDYKRLIGFTATPSVYGKNIYTEVDGVKFVEPYTLSEIFDDIVCGPDVKELIELGYLVQDYNIALKLPDFDKLRESKSNPDGYTAKSMNEVYHNTASLEILDKAYYKYCEGKKVLLFNSSNKVNKFIYEHFKEKGVNCMMFDTSSNKIKNEKTGKNYTRKEVIEWFKNERNAMLINTNVFTTGFDVSDVEVVVVNRATKSLSLWIQMVGRGSRITDKIYKDKFTVIDLGQNIYEHGMWSLERDWKQYFYSPGPRPINVIDLLQTWDCEFCGYINVKGTTVCEDCGAEKLKVDTGKDKKTKTGELETIQEMPPPRGNAIVRYAKSKGEDQAFCFKLLHQKILDLFVHYRVSQDFYKRAKFERYTKDGETLKGFDQRITEIFRPCYFAIINSDLPGKNRRYKTELERMINKVDEFMNFKLEL